MTQYGLYLAPPVAGMVCPAIRVSQSQWLVWFAQRLEFLKAVAGMVCPAIRVSQSFPFCFRSMLGGWVGIYSVWG
jgi:hypothetical protein